MSANEAPRFPALLDQGDFCGAVSLPRMAEGTARLQYRDVLRGVASRGGADFRYLVAVIELD